MSFLFLLFSFFFSENGGVKIEKQLLYDRHTLEDNYEYRKVERSFQWDKIAGMIDSLLKVYSSLLMVLLQIFIRLMKRRQVRLI